MPSLLGIPNCSLLLCSYAWETLDVFLELVEVEIAKLNQFLPSANSWFGVQVFSPSGTLSKLLLWGVFTLELGKPIEAIFPEGVWYMFRLVQGFNQFTCKPLTCTLFSLTDL